MSERDAWNVWAGISHGPQSMNCALTYVPVYVEAQQRQQVIANVAEAQAILAAQSHGHDPMETVEYHFDRYGYQKTVRMPLWYAIRIDSDATYRKWYMKEFKVTSGPKAPPLPEDAAHGRIEFWELW
jgi:alkylated DNA repair dioxygenase AlkB